MSPPPPTPVSPTRVGMVQAASFYPWFNKLNRNRGVNIQLLLDRWLDEENKSVSEDAARYSALLARTRAIAGDEGMVTRSQAQALTKEFDPSFADGSRVVELGKLVNSLFEEWGDPETKEHVPYLHLIIAWIKTRQFRRGDDNDEEGKVANFTGNR